MLTNLQKTNFYCIPFGQTIRKCLFHILQHHFSQVSSLYLKGAEYISTVTCFCRFFVFFLLSVCGVRNWSPSLSWFTILSSLLKPQFVFYLFFSPLIMWAFWTFFPTDHLLPEQSRNCFPLRGSPWVRVSWSLCTQRGTEHNPLESFSKKKLNKGHRAKDSVMKNDCCVLYIVW